ncbi:hypothetical protein [Pedobacter sp. Leaf250]|uniref:hypothetical protein n=1 Tax=Pedobacter sp. Leaf250 TaxID=2876559 RepID=UPI001E3F0490|nr:hypothetical protein [Pedobacter sp. Leaf250]
MKNLLLSFVCLLTMISFNSLASDSKTDTLKKTSQYVLYSKTENINDIFISKNKKSKDNIVSVKISFASVQSNSNAIKTAVLQGNKQYGEDNHPTISSVKILKGKYEDMKGEAASKTASLYTFTKLEFPLHLQVSFMGEIVDFELLEPGKWDIDLKLKK